MKFEGLQKKVSQFMKNLTADTFFQSTEYLEYLQKMVQAVLSRCLQEAGKKNPPRIKVQLL